MAAPSGLLYLRFLSMGLFLGRYAENEMSPKQQKEKYY